MPSVVPISACAFAGRSAVAAFAGTVKERLNAVRRGVLTGVEGEGEEAILFLLLCKYW